MNIPEIRRLVDGHSHWYHRIELAPGVVTPGAHASPEALARLDALGLPRDLTGQRVLDVGCRDGFFAFEMERRGADVVGLDYAGPEVTGFGVASRVLGSRVQYVVANAYDMDPARLGRFDVVLFLGVLYHLRNPLLALDRVRLMAMTGGLVVVETHVDRDWAWQRFVPRWRFYPRDTLAGDHTTKWAPNLQGLVSALEECQIAVSKTAVYGNRAIALGTAFVDERLEFFRTLDAESGARVPARPNVRV